MKVEFLHHREQRVLQLLRPKCKWCVGRKLVFIVRAVLKTGTE